MKSTINGTITTYFVGAHYEVTSSTVTKYYYAGSQRIAMRTNGTLQYLLGDHLGSTSLTTDAVGNGVSEVRYKAWGEVRYAAEGVPTKYQYTGQFSYEPEFGLYFYNARWYDSALGRFAQADTIIPPGVQGLDRYAYTLNNPLRYTDSNGHRPCDIDNKGNCILSSEPFTKGQVISRLRHYGVKITGHWSFENLYAVFAGVDAIGAKLVQELKGTAEDAFTGSSADAFRRAFTSVTMNWNDGICGAQTDRCYADANSFPTINFYSRFWAGSQDERGNNLMNPIPLGTPAVTLYLVIHELGHGFDSRTNRSFNQSLIDEGITDKTGFGMRVGRGGQHEVTADLFLNYIVGSITGPGTNGANLQQFLDTNIAGWVTDAATP